MHDDIQTDLQLLRPLAEAVCKFADMLEAMGERVEKLEKVVLDDIIGGVTKLYKTNERLKGVEDLRGKYSSMLEPDELDAFKEFYGDRDMFSDIYDMLDKMRGEEGYSDEAADERIKGILGEFKGKVAKFKPKPAEVAIEVETSTEPEEEAEAEKPAEESIKERVERMKRSNPFKR